MRRIVTVLVAALAAGIPAVRAAEPATAHVHVLDTLPVPTFAPDDVTIRIGDTVSWDNHATRVHTVTHDRCPRIDLRLDPAGCAFDTTRDTGSDLEPGDVFEVTLTTPGVYGYVCAIHRFGARITVLDEDGTLPDLVVDDVDVHETPLRTSKRVEAVVGNDGEATSPISRLHFEIRGADGVWRQFGDVAVGPIGPGERRTLNQDLTSFNKAGDFEIRVTADGAATVVESDEANNRRTVATSILLPAGTAPGLALPDPPKPEPVTTRLPAP